jgi:hypothetical protein
MMTSLHAYGLSMPDCPLRLGTPLKVATTAWNKWGIDWKEERDFLRLVKESEEAYDEEWSSTNSGGLKDIARAAELSGLGDANRRLNEGVAHEVEHILNRHRNHVCVMDLGAGSGDTTGAIVRLVLRYSSIDG